MNAWRRRFTEHPASVGESYLEHCAQASGFGLRMIGCGLICLVHAVLPFVFRTKAGDMVGELHERMITRRRAYSGQ